MSGLKSLAKETLIYSIGSFGSKILSFLLLPLYTFFLVKKDLGEYDILITTVTLLVPLVSMQMSDAVYRFLIPLNEEDVFSKHKIITNSMFVLVMFYLIFVVFFFVYSFFQKFNYSFYFVFLVFFSSVLPFFQSILRGLKRIKDFAVYGIITSISLVFFNIVFVYFFKLKVEGILLANIFGNLIAVLIIFWRARLFLFINLKQIDVQLIKAMLSYSIPLIPNLMSWWLIGFASKFIILYYMGIEANGIYSVSNRFASILVLINSVLVLPIQDSFLKNNITTDEFNKIINQFIKMELSIILLLSVGAPIYVKYFVSADYYESWLYMPLLYLGVGFSAFGTLISLVYQKTKNTFKITVTTLLSAVVTTGLCFLLIGKYHLNAVSFSYFIGFLLLFLIRYFDVKSAHQMNIDFSLLSWLICVILILLLFQYKINFMGQCLLFVGCTIGVLLFNKKIILNIIKRC